MRRKNGHHVCSVCGGTMANVVWTYFYKEWVCSSTCLSKSEKIHASHESVEFNKGLRLNRLLDEVHGDK